MMKFLILFLLPTLVWATVTTTPASSPAQNINASVPSQTSNSGKFLTTDGTVVSWGTAGAGSVTSVAASVPSIFSISGSPITTTGTLAMTYSGTALPIANGGTAATTASAGFNALSPMTTGGDLIYGAASGAGTRLANGTAGDTLLSAGGTAAPVWTAIPQVQHATVATTCTSTPCTITRQGPISDWITSITRASTGNYTLNIKAGVFSASPACHIDGDNASINLLCDAWFDSATGGQFFCTTPTTNAVTDSRMRIICVGPR